jgi:hypothetical protein
MDICAKLDIARLHITTQFIKEKEYYVNFTKDEGV